MDVRNRLPGCGAKNAATPLDELPRVARGRQDEGVGRGRDVHTLIEAANGDHYSARLLEDAERRLRITFHRGVVLVDLPYARLFDSAPYGPKLFSVLAIDKPALPLLEVPRYDLRCEGALGGGLLGDARTLNE